MAETNFTLHSTDPNNYKLQKTFTGVNPYATSAELVETAQGFNRLSDNTYVGTKRIVKYDADSEESGAKPVPTLTVGDFTKQDVGYRATFTYNGDGIVCARPIPSSGNNPPVLINNNNIIIQGNNGVTSGTVITVTITASATANYAPPATVTKTFTWEG